MPSSVVFNRRTIVALATALTLHSQTAAEESPSLQFSRDILPVLSENCFFCHGPDEQQRQADLRLDVEDDAIPTLSRNSPSESELLRRILSNDPDEMMPPTDSNRSLSRAQKLTVKQWIEGGSKWGRHWSFEALTAPKVPNPTFPDFAVHNPIDAFVQSKLKENQLKPSHSAEKHTLIRRVTLDLTGLPPTVAEVESFLADNSTDAYEKLVDRLLNSRSYGERMAWDWLDAARYADTNGYQGDRERTMWPWRDWVVDAFNDNMPFDQFTTLQLAGDLLPNATDEQVVATGFCRNHMINGEGGRIPEENRVDYVMDMSETMGTVWLGLTLNCCRCHDHKYDPLTQKEYYQFFAYFNQTPVTGGGGDPQTAPNLAVPTTEQKQKLSDLQQQLKDVTAAQEKRQKQLQPLLTKWEEEQRTKSAVNGWKVLSPSEMSAEKQTLILLEDQSILAEGTNAENDTYKVLFSVPSGPMSAVRLEAIQHESLTKNGLARSDSGNFVLTEFECSLKHANKTTPLKIASADATFEQGSLKIEGTFDGNRNTGWAVYQGRPIDQSHAAVFLLAEPVEVEADTILQVVLRHDSVHRFHNLGRFRISVSSAANPQLETADTSLLADLKTAPADRKPAQQERILAAYLKQDSEYNSLEKQRQLLTKQEANTRKGAPRVMVMKDQDEWRPTFVLNRGLYNDITDQEVTALTPASLPKSVSASGKQNRLDLAQWLLSKDHPLTARVTVNRFWQQFFGLGLVKTTENFGVQAEYPVQKELLDWLAADFRDHGWDVKRLVKTIVMSHTYRQSSVITDADSEANLAVIDPENRLLARASRFRMPAWMLRDRTLALSGLLNDKPGGPPVNTYQPAGVWEEATFGKKKYSRDSGERLYRRSLYIFWRRIIAPTMFFDNASRQSCTVKSLRTNTPLHALLTLNETTYVESARALAQQLLRDKSLTDDRSRINNAALRILSRRLLQQELKIVEEGIQRSVNEYASNLPAAKDLLSVGESARDESLDIPLHAAWTSACLMLLNTDEALTRE